MKKFRVTTEAVDAPLSQYFDAEDDRSESWNMWCKHCKKGWSLKKPKPGEQVGVGNLLHLLNHAKSHKENR